MRNWGYNVHEYRPKAKKQEIGRNKRQNGWLAEPSAFCPFLQGGENHKSNAKAECWKVRLGKWLCPSKASLHSRKSPVGSVLVFYYLSTSIKTLQYSNT